MHRIFEVRSHYQKIKEFVRKYERWLMPVTLVTGFLVDYITFVNIQINTAIIILFVHFFTCAFAIAFIYAYDAGKISQRLRYLRLFAPLLVQFNFGGLLSSVYFFATFTILSVSLPFIFNSLSSLWFILSSLLALAFIACYIWLLYKIAGKEKLNLRNLAISIFAILFVTNLFYFANLIPPVPLAMRETGVYHNVERRGGQYILRGEREDFWEKLVPGKIIHLQQGQRAYVYSAIFAPKELNTSITHEWQYYDETQGSWVVKDRLSFNLVGGRKGGFRGYSFKTTLATGDWRVFIKTQRGQTLGRVKFEVERPTSAVELFEVVR